MKQKLPNPTIGNGQGPTMQQIAASQQASQLNVTALAPPPPKPVTYAVDGSIELRNAVIELEHHRFVHGLQTNKLTVKFARIVGAAIVIDELNLILPVAGTVIKTEKI